MPQIPAVTPEVPNQNKNDDYKFWDDYLNSKQFIIDSHRLG